MQAELFNYIALAVFMIALVHTFASKWFEQLAHKYPKHQGLYHLLAEVEIVFGFWAFILVGIAWALQGKQEVLDYLNQRNFTEALFVAVMMIVSASQPILQFSNFLIGLISKVFSKLLNIHRSLSLYWVVMGLVPLLGSLITEPAAITIAAIILAKRFMQQDTCIKFKYATLATLFLNISIGGTLTAFAAPPVLMVASAWGWDNLFMLKTFGIKAGIAVFINASLLTIYFRKTILEQYSQPKQQTSSLYLNEQLSKNEQSNLKTPYSIILIHLLFLAGIVASAHYTVVFIGLFLLFLGITQAYQQYQSRLLLKEGLLVGFFLAGLIVLGGYQQWWLESVLTSLNTNYANHATWVTLPLSAVTDNAAIAYLASLVNGLSDTFKYNLMVGALSAGGLTLIANAPNLVGFSLLKEHFAQQAVQPLYLMVAALIPTCVALICFLA